MMANTVTDLTNYYNVFKSPVKTYQANPVTNLIYGAMANKFYLQTVAKKSQSAMSSYLTSLNSNITNLKNASKSLTTKGPDSSYNQKSVNSSNTDSVTGKAIENATVADYKLNVSKLAKSQSNFGVGLNSTETTSFNKGVNSFSLKIGKSESKNISFNINNTDTNKSSLDKMAKAINSAKTGVNASVYTDSQTGKSSLHLSSTATGTDAAFTLTDINGNATSVSGSNNIKEESQNAEYTLDGKKYTSQSNNIKLDNNKVEITLKKAENKDIKFNVKTDVNAIKSDIKDFVDNYNDMVELTNNYSSELSGAKKLSEEFNNITSSKRASLERMGITENSDGTLSVDDKRLDYSIASNLQSVKDTFSGNNGLAEKIYSKSNEVLSRPMKYSKPTESKENFNSFYNYMSANNSASYSQNMYSGMLFDSSL